ncbi:hypothetical protein WICPIJ_000932 [Wickerhamomyces pijperi]|uniref:Uncharacterized protein n=1 Tax=Wickerhamomyces pijperi TaxID=599730 RepID=A0A9P8QEY4_WICPI|nr:hypothetical protein WICPIJ_000932 [Wickerhamomyces pijperi]
MMVFLPLALRALAVDTAHQSNSTEDPIRYTPDPKTSVPWSSNSTSFSVAFGPNSEGDLLIGEPQLLSSGDDISVQPEQRPDGLQLSLLLNNVLTLVQEPFVNLGQLMDPVNGVVLMQQGLAHSQPSSVRWLSQGAVQVFKLATLEPDKRRINLSDCLLERLFKRTPNGHHLTDRLHRGPDVSLHVLELGKIPSWNLCDHVIQRRFEIGRGGLGHRVWQFRQGVTKRDLSSGVSQRVTGGLRSQSRGSGQTGIHLDDSVVQPVRLQGVLDVTLTNDTQMSDDLDGSGTQHVVLLVRESLRRSNDDRITSVDPQWVKVLHVTNSDTVPHTITHNFVLDLLPPL